MRVGVIIVTFVLGTSARLAPAQGGEWSSKGELGIESRVFDDDGDDTTEDRGLGLLGRLDLRHSHGPLAQKVRFYGRLDHYDEDRSTLVFEEAWLQAASERLRVRAGIDVLNWTATEAFHPADVINARNLDSDLENFEKVGEAMLSLQVRPFEDTTVGAMYMPYRTEPIFTSPRSRLGFTRGFDLRGTRRMFDRQGRATKDQLGHQGAVVLRQVVGSADISLHVLEHMDRAQPIVGMDMDNRLPFLVFQTVRQVGGTYQQAIDALLIKVEGAYRMFVDPRLPPPGVEGQPDHGQVALGLEYGLVHGSSESTLLLEGQAVLGVGDEMKRSALSVFQRDVLVGYRFALNDESSKEVMLGAIFDLERAGETLLNVNYQQRLGDTWTIRAGLRIFHAKDDAPGPLVILRTSDHVRLTLTRHF